MLMAKIEEGKEYYAMRYLERGLSLYNATDHTWERLERMAMRVRVVAKDQQTARYAKPVLFVVPLDKNDGEQLPMTVRDGVEDSHIVMQPAQIVMPWDDYVVAYHDYCEEQERKFQEHRDRRERQQREAQEKAASDWMKRVFAEAKSDLEDMAAIGLLASDMGAYSDAHIQRLVDHRYPGGNPYLNGEKVAMAY